MNLRKMQLTQPILATIALIGLPALTYADLQDDLNARWRGAWVIVEGELYSNCNGGTTDNRVSGDLISGRGRHAFEPGELAQITRVDARRRRVDVFLNIYENLLVEYSDGPFTLYNEVSCPVELELDFGSARTSDIGLAGVEVQFDQWFERHARLEDAQSSINWNGRVREDYPSDYDLTLAEYEAWKVDQHNVLVADKIDYSIEQTGYLLAQVSSNSEFGSGLGYGIAAMREDMAEDCGRLVASSSDTFARAYKADNPDWGNGYKTGQQLAYHIELSRRLPNCFIEPAVTVVSLD